ncbi:neurogenic locus notch homolog 3-like, partial [Paramuricea clavata]
EARDVCTANGLETTLLNNCVFDILATNDTSFADQQSLKIGCPNDCTGKGLCKNETCTCLDGWSGDDCSIGSCGNCSRGSCVEGFCQCDIGWEGAECDKKATCFVVDNCTSEVHGSCKTTDVCECNVGYTGLNCSIITNCNNVLNCSSNGDCVDMDVCKCHTGYSGSACNETSCESLGYCSGIPLIYFQNLF